MMYKKASISKLKPILNGADDEIRTRDPDLGKVVLYQLSYICFSTLWFVAFDKPFLLERCKYKISLFNYANRLDYFYNLFACRLVSSSLMIWLLIVYGCKIIVLILYRALNSEIIGRLNQPYLLTLSELWSNSWLPLACREAWLQINGMKFPLGRERPTSKRGGV